MLIDYANVLIFLGIGAFFIIFNLFLGSLIRPKNPSAEKLSTYECGEEPVGGSWIQFNIRFYVVALVFIIFDVEVVFLYPWAVVVKDLMQYGWFAFVEMMIFVAILLVGLAYAWKRGALEWVVAQIPDQSEERAA